MDEREREEREKHFREAFGIPDDTAYLEGNQIPVFNNVKWVDWMYCYSSTCQGEPTWHRILDDPEHSWRWECKVCGKITYPPPESLKTHEPPQE